METFVSNIQQCHDLIAEAVPLTLIYYSHIGLVGVALLLGGFVIVKDRSATGKSFFLLALLFGAWALVDVFLWTGTDSRVYMYLWPIANLLEVLIFIAAFLFFFAFINKRADTLVRSLCFLLTLPAIALVWTTNNLLYFDTGLCIPVEGWFWQRYIFPLQLVLTSWIFVMGLYHTYKAVPGIQRQTTLLITFATTLFLGSFIMAGLVVNLTDFNYNYEILAFIGTAIFLSLLTYLIVKYNSFSIKTLGAQILVIALVTAVASQFLYIQNPVNKILNGVSLGLVVIFGYLLIGSVKKEVAARQQIEVLAKELGIANKQQVALIRFITHQVKGFLTKSRNIFSTILDGDYGTVTDGMKTLVQEGFNSDTKGVETVQDILNASNIRSGKVQYTMAPFDLKQLVEEIVKDQKLAAEAKGLAFSFSSDEEPFTVTGDRMQLINVFKNLIDNSIKYTPTGTVAVTLSHAPEKVVFKIEDTGVGITAEDKEHLFTEGGHGKDSQKTNTESTGFGLYIVKNIIEAHKGRVWAESEGVGKGSRFIVELPL